jgi:nucleotide-binding universal stress UspA family protein
MASRNRRPRDRDSKILCPIDFSDYSRRALDHAVAIARWYESTITVMHVFSTMPVAAYAPGAPAPGFEFDCVDRADRDQLLAEMTRFIETESRRGPVEAIIREGRTAPRS